MPFLVEFRHYDYADWYPDWVEPPETAEKEKFKESLMGPLLGDDKFWNSRTEFTIDSVYPNPFVFVHFRTGFSIHNALKTIIISCVYIQFLIYWPRPLKVKICRN